MPEYLLPILLFVIACSGLAIGMLAIGSLLGPKRNSDVKEMPYESGMDPIHDARRRFDVRFHLVAITFLLFDVELLFLYPWAVANRHPEGLTNLIGDGEGARQAHLLVFGEVLVFLVLLALGLVYAWRKGVFRWR
jgi:NADH-quinone oxidoreductase subunit A